MAGKYLNAANYDNYSFFLLFFGAANIYKKVEFVSHRTEIVNKMLILDRSILPSVRTKSQIPCSQEVHLSLYGCLSFLNQLDIYIYK